MNKREKILQDLYGRVDVYDREYMDIYKITLDHLHLTNCLTESTDIRGRDLFFFTTIASENVQDPIFEKLHPFVDFACHLLPSKNSLPIYIIYDGASSDDLPWLHKQSQPEQFYEITITKNTKRKDLALKWLELLSRVEAIPDEQVLRYIPEFLRECDADESQLDPEIKRYFEDFLK